MTRYYRPLQAVLDPEQLGWPPARAINPDLCREDLTERREREMEREREEAAAGA